MSWQKSSKPLLRAAAEMVDEFVRAMRGRGMRWDAALEQGALHFEVTPRRVRALLMDEAEKMPPDEFERINKRFDQFLIDDEAYHAACAAERRARRLQRKLDFNA